MKVLFLVQYIANNNILEFSKSKGGFGYMVYDIARTVACNNETDTFVLNYRYKSLSSEGIKFITNTITSSLRNLFKCVSFGEVIRLYHQYHMSYKELLVLIYHWIQTGHIRSILEKGHYDIVHCHGCYFGNTLLLKLFEQTNQKVVFTLHGLNSISDSIHIEKACKQYERDFLQRIYEEKIPLTVISSGIKKNICKLCKAPEISNIRVVTNGCSIPVKANSTLDIRGKYGIPTNAKIVLYVGNITYNKNQQQMVESFGLMSRELCEQTYILFLGRNIEPGYGVEKLIETSEYKSNLILCGNVDKEDIASYYSQADGVALLSHEEGFGLSLVEGMIFGVPCMTHKDIYAFEDIYNPKAMVGIENRSNESVARALKKLLSSNWDKEEIKEYSKSFSMEAMGEKYVNYYKEIAYGR